MSDQITFSESPKPEAQTTNFSDYIIGAARIAAGGPAGLAADMATRSALKNGVQETGKAIAEGVLDLATGGIGKAIKEAAKNAVEEGNKLDKDGNNENSWKDFKKGAKEGAQSGALNSAGHGVGRLAAEKLKEMKEALENKPNSQQEKMHSPDTLKEAMKEGARLGLGSGSLLDELNKPSENKLKDKNGSQSPHENGEKNSLNKKESSLKDLAADAAAAAITAGMLSRFGKRSMEKAGEQKPEDKPEHKNHKDETQKSIENNLKGSKSQGLNLVDEIMSTPQDVIDHFKNNPGRATVEALISPIILVGDAKASKK